MAVFLVIALRVIAAEGRHFDDLAAEVHMHQLEAATDHPRVAKLGADLLGRGAGGNVEILGLYADQQVAHAAADQVGLVAGFLQTVHHAHRVAAELAAMQRMLARAEHFGRAAGAGLALERER